MALLEMKDLGITFGGLKAVSDVNLKVEAGELVGLIGPNGAGKTTIFNLLTGVYRPTTGTVTLDGKLLNGMKPYKIVDEGIARTFQNIRLFKQISVMDNIKVAFNHKMRYSAFESILRLPRYWKEEAEIEKKAMQLLELFDMEDVAQFKASNLPYGQQRKLEILRALATGPKLLLLDEPAAGMNPTETQELMETIALIRKKFKITILLIEHDMKLVLGICEKIAVLNYGQIIAQGTPDEVVNDKTVIEAYLGE